MNIWITTTIMGFFGMFYILWLIKKELPIRDKRIKKEWETEVKIKDAMEIHKENEELKIQQVINKNKIESIKKYEKEIATDKKRLSDNNEKPINLYNSIKNNKSSLNRKQMYKDNKKKGRDYELFILKYFEKQGYKTKDNSFVNGKKDNGIDLIILKNKEITLIQCKNWKKDSSYKIKHRHLKEFLGNTTAFLYNNKEKAKGYKIKRMYITSNDVLDNSAKHFLNNNSILEHRVIPYI